MLVVNVFLILYIFSWLFLAFFLAFIGLSIISTKWWKEKVDSGKTCRVFYSSTVVVVILSLLDLSLSIALLIMEAIHISTKKPVWFLKDTTRKFVYQHQSYLYVFLAIRELIPVLLLTPMLLIAPLLLTLALTAICYCCHSSLKNKKNRTGDVLTKSN